MGYALIHPFHIGIPTDAGALRQTGYSDSAGRQAGRQAEAKERWQGGSQRELAESD
jgi:hypothetical protein